MSKKANVAIVHDGDDNPPAEVVSTLTVATDGAAEVVHEPELTLTPTAPTESAAKGTESRTRVYILLPADASQPTRYIESTSYTRAMVHVAEQLYACSVAKPVDLRAAWKSGLPMEVAGDTAALQEPTP